MDHQTSTSQLNLSDRAAHDAMIRAALQRLAEQWTPIVTALLHDIARDTWGQDAYSVISTVAERSCSWTAVCQRDGDFMNYQVILRLTLASPDALQHSSDAPVVQPAGFTVSGLNDFSAEPTEEALKRAMWLARRVGPKGWGLTQAEEEALAKMDYKPGEYAPRNWEYVAVCSVTIVAGVVLIGYGLASHLWLALPGLLLAAIGVFGLMVTAAGRKFDRLRGRKKMAAVIAAAPGVFLIGALFIFLIAAFVFIKTDLAVRLNKMVASIFEDLF